MRLPGKLSLALLGLLPNASCILPRSSNAPLSGESSFIDTETAPTGSDYVKLELDETPSGFIKHLFPSHESCTVIGATISKNDSIYRYQTEVTTPEECQTLCSKDVRCTFARHLVNESICQFLDYSTTSLTGAHPDGSILNSDCDNSCFTSSTRYHNETEVRAAVDPLHCHNLCIQNSQCNAFSFDRLKHKCYFFSEEGESSHSSVYISGPGVRCDKPIQTSVPSCTAEGFCDQSCYMPDVTFSGSYSSPEVSEIQECHKACNEDGNCANWTFIDGVCNLHNGSQSVQSIKHEGAVAGPHFACGTTQPMPRAIYNLNSTLSGLLYLQKVEDVADLAECEQFCNKRRRCSGFTYAYIAKTCQLVDISAHTPETSVSYIPQIAGIAHGNRQSNCSKFTRIPQIESTEVHALNLLQCILSARTTPGVLSYVWVNGKCHHLSSVVEQETQGDETGNSVIYGASGVCAAASGSTESCYLENTAIIGEVSKSFDDFETPEECANKCREFPWCIGTNWQSNVNRCHMIDNITSLTENADYKLASKSCDTSCFEEGYVYEAPVLEEITAPTAGICQMLCQGKKFCVTFSYDTTKSLCTLHKARGDIKKKQDSISGPKMFCDAPHNDFRQKLQPPQGWEHLTHKVYLRSEEAVSADDCKEKCDREPECAMSTFTATQNQCDLKPQYRQFKNAIEKYQDVSMLKLDNLECYQRGSMAEGAVHISQATYASASQCATACLSFTNCHGVVFDPDVKEGTSCRIYDLAGFRLATTEGNKIINIVGPCS